jgi:type I restriction enzyme, S subunit
MIAWRREPFDNVISDESGGNVKTLRSEFLPSGRYPIVDQGKELVAGYTDDETRLCRAKLPVIVFGDHTRCFKYVDFPFCMGADGIKVLRPKIDADVKYLYYYLRQLRLTEGGYDRHFKYLKRSIIALPPIPEQQRIAAILDKADALRVKRREAIVQLDTMTQALFFEMFGDPIGNPRKFPIRQMIEIVDAERPISYGILMPGPDQSEGVKYIRVIDMQDGGVELSGIRQTTETISHAFRRSLLRAGDLLMSIRGHVGRMALVPADLEGANITQDTARLAILGADPIFVRECLRTASFQQWMARHTKGVAVRGINLTDVKRMPMIMPSVTEQREFARRAALVDDLRVRERQSRAYLDSLFSSLQHKAFQGQL